MIGSSTTTYSCDFLAKIGNEAFEASPYANACRNIGSTLNRPFSARRWQTCAEMRWQACFLGPPALYVSSCRSPIGILHICQKHLSVFLRASVAEGNKEISL